MNLTKTNPMDLLEKIKITRIQLLNEEQEHESQGNQSESEKCKYARHVFDEIIEWNDLKDPEPFKYENL